MSKLSEPEILARLPMAKAWDRHGDMMVRTWQFPSFRRALEFVNQVGSLFDKTEHYPDLIVTYRTVRIEISTHDVGGLTERDFELIVTLNEIPDRSMNTPGLPSRGRLSYAAARPGRAPPFATFCRTGAGIDGSRARGSPIHGRTPTVLAEASVAGRFPSGGKTPPNFGSNEFAGASARGFGRLGPDCPGANRRYLVLGRL